MKPLKTATILALWLMRLSLITLIFLTFGSETLAFEYKSKEFYVATSFVVFSFLLLVGGFMPKSTLTVVSGFFLAAICLYSILIQISNGINVSIATFLIIFSVSFFFVCNGNK